MENIQQVSKGSTELGNNGSDKNNTTESKESAFKCAQETVCEYCLEKDGWVYYRKGSYNTIMGNTTTGQSRLTALQKYLSSRVIPSQNKEKKKVNVKK